LVGKQDAKNLFIDLSEMLNCNPPEFIEIESETVNVDEFLVFEEFLLIHSGPLHKLFQKSKI
jgi:hypothetical protein